MLARLKPSDTGLLSATKTFFFFFNWEPKNCEEQRAWSLDENVFLFYCVKKRVLFGALCKTFFDVIA